MISKEKLDKVKRMGTDSSDLILKMYEYLEYNYHYFDSSNVVDKIDMVNYDDVKSSIIFSVQDYKAPPIHSIKVENIRYMPSKSSNTYYASKEYELKLEFYKKCIETLGTDFVGNNEKILVILDISSISSYPLWNTMMRRRMNNIIASIEKADLDEISDSFLTKVIKKSEKKSVNYEENKYDIDFVIELLRKLAKSASLVPYFIDNQNTNESRFLVSELQKFIYALSIKEDSDKYKFIYDTICSDMDEMFSKFGFCNFKENKCVAQRHKNLFSRYPVPKTDGCCFKVVRKCEHNNKDGTCKVKCLPCKLFTCPFLGKTDIGIRASELILMRSFLNNRQKRTLIYKFYTSEEVLLKKVNMKK